MDAKAGPNTTATSAEHPVYSPTSTPEWSNWPRGNWSFRDEKPLEKLYNYENDQWQQLRPPDRKDVKGPEPYSGDITQWT